MIQHPDSYSVQQVSDVSGVLWAVWTYHARRIHCLQLDDPRNRKIDVDFFTSHPVVSDDLCGGCDVDEIAWSNHHSIAFIDLAVNLSTNLNPVSYNPLLLHLLGLSGRIIARAQHICRFYIWSNLC